MNVRGGRKRRVRDEKILAKAKKHMTSTYNQMPAEDEDDDDNQPLPQVTDEEMFRMLNPDPDAPPAKKLRKPRHTEKKPKPSTTNDDSAAEVTKKKKKKKKKKTKGVVTPSPKPSKNPASIDRHSSDTLDFLQKWKHCRSDWKFEKLKQVWLLQNCLNPELIPDSIFPVLLEYMGSVRGQARVATEKEMEVAMKAYEITQNPSDGATLRYDRARQIVQMLSTE